MFGLAADAATPPYRNKEPQNAANVNNSVSYPGAFNTRPGGQVAIPPPNLQLKGPTGQPVLDSIAQEWAAQRDAPTPYDGSGSPRDGDLNLPVYKRPAPNSA